MERDWGFTEQVGRLAVHREMGQAWGTYGQVWTGMGRPVMMALVKGEHRVLQTLPFHLHPRVKLDRSSGHSTVTTCSAGRRNGSLLWRRARQVMRGGEHGGHSAPCITHVPRATA